MMTERNTNTEGREMTTILFTGDNGSRANFNAWSKKVIINGRVEFRYTSIFAGRDADGRDWDSFNLSAGAARRMAERLGLREFTPTNRLAN